jgi:glycosyltransferase involved in cell wall biosynthesis
MKLIFVNPYSHHSYFSVLALSRIDNVEVLCPPLILELLLNRWKPNGLRIHNSGFVHGFPKWLAFMSFLARKSGLISDKVYLQCFLFSAKLFLNGSKNHCVYSYQDYILPLMLNSSASQKFIVEFIIQIPPDQPNCKPSIEAAHIALGTLAPTNIIINELGIYGFNADLAPYGGDKSAYRPKALENQSMNSFKVFKQQKQPNKQASCSNFLIVARSNSFRKGLDILLEALEGLNQDFPVSDWACCEVVICGNISDPLLAERVSTLSKSFKSTDKIKIKAGQLEQDSYLNLLEAAKIFLMPSRLEGTSYAALEALWQGVPSILSPACGVEMFRPGFHGELLEPNTSSSLLKILQRCISFPERLEFFRSSLYHDRHFFTWNRYLEAVSYSVQNKLMSS